MAYTHLIFDWDGTIANTKKLWIATYKEILLQEYNLSISESEIATKAYGISSGVTDFGIDDYKLFNTQLFDRVKKSFYMASLFPGIKRVLKKLKTQHELTIATSTERRMIQESLEFHRLTSLFSHVVAREDVLEHKPNPQAINVIIDKLKCDRKSTIIIGDSDKDIIAGQRAGIDTILFLAEQNTKYNNQEEVTLLELKPSFVIRRHNELLTIFNE